VRESLDVHNGDLVRVNNDVVGHLGAVIRTSSVSSVELRCSDDRNSRGGGACYCPCDCGSLWSWCDGSDGGCSCSRLGVADVAAAEFLAAGLEVRNVAGADRYTIVALIGETKTVLDGVVIIAAVLSIVRGEGSIPLLSVHGAVLTLRNPVLEQNVGVEVAAQLRLAIGRWVFSCPFVLLLAGSCTELGIECGLNEELVAHVGALLVAVERRVDRTVLELDLLVALSRLCRERRVAVASSDGDLKLFSPLSVVVGGVGVDWSAPERALDVGNSFGVSAFRSWVCRRVALNIDVETETPILGVALRCAVRWVVGLDYLVAKVPVGTTGTLQVGEGVEVSRGCGSTLGYRCNLGIGAELASRGQVEAVSVGVAGLRVAGPTPQMLLDLRYGRRLRHRLNVKRISDDLGDDIRNSLRDFERNCLFLQAGNDVDDWVYL